MKTTRRSTFLRRSALALAAAGVLSVPALGTWSILVINHATGEIAIAGATCIPDINLKNRIGVILAGVGAGVVQASAPISARSVIWDGMHAGDTPDEILESVKVYVGQQSLGGDQYGIVAFNGPPVSFTGNNNGQAALGVVGEIGDLSYAIQGNVLAGPPVVLEAEQVLLNTPGDLSQKVMAAMQIARDFGGDGRCSCNPGAPDSCGSPPAFFGRTAFAAFMMVSRPGDSSGPNCCTHGDWYMRRVVITSPGDPGAIKILKRKYFGWRQNRLAEPDHYLSQVSTAAPRLVADGVTSTQVSIRSVNIDGEPLTTGGVTVQVVQTSPGAAVATPGPVTDHGDGTYSFDMTATATPGSGSWQIVMTTPLDDVWLQPELALEVDPLADLHAGYTEVSASAGGYVPLVVNRGVADAGRLYMVLASASGTSPGVFFNGQVIPLNPDGVLRFTVTKPLSQRFPGGAGQLDAFGRAEATWRANPGALIPFIGRRFDFLGVLSGSPDDLTALDGFDVLP